MRTLHVIALTLIMLAGSLGAVWCGALAAHARSDAQFLILAACGAMLAACGMGMAVFVADAAARAETMQRLREGRGQ